MSSTNPMEAEMAQQSSSKPENMPDVENPSENQNQNHNQNQTQNQNQIPNPNPNPNQNQNQNHATGVVGILRRWTQDQEMAKKRYFALRISSWVFSFLAFMIMPTSKHGDWFDWSAFNQYEELRYAFIIANLSLFYTWVQAWRQYDEITTGKQVHSCSIQNLALIDFVGDQIMAYLLISAASSLAPLANRMREEGVNNAFTRTLAASISMEFFAFFVLGLSAILSGYNLVKTTDI